MSSFLHSHNRSLQFLIYQKHIPVQREVPYSHITYLVSFNFGCAELFFSNSLRHKCTFSMPSTRTHSICTVATNEVYILPVTVSPATKMFSYHQPRTYIEVFHVFHQQSTTHIRPHKITFYGYLVVGCIFLWLLSYIYKPLNMIEIMHNRNTNNEGRIYTLQSFSKTFVPEGYIEIHMLQRKLKVSS